MEELAQILKHLKDDQKQFKKDHRDVFAENRKFNKSINKAGDDLLALMDSKGIDTFEYDGTEYTKKVTRSEKHNIERITDLVDDKEALKEYIDDIACERKMVTTRRQKKQKTSDWRSAIFK